MDDSWRSCSSCLFGVAFQWSLVFLFFLSVTSAKSRERYTEPANCLDLEKQNRKTSVAFLNHSISKKRPSRLSLYQKTTKKLGDCLNRNISETSVPVACPRHTNLFLRGGGGIDSSGRRFSKSRSSPTGGSVRTVTIPTALCWTVLPSLSTEKVSADMQARESMCCQMLM